MVILVCILLWYKAKNEWGDRESVVSFVYWLLRLEKKFSPEDTLYVYIQNKAKCWTTEKACLEIQISAHKVLLI